MEIKLSPAEIFSGSIAGIMRQVENLKMGRKHAHGANDENDWQMHIEGALGEMAVAKFLGIYWTGKGKLRAPDVGEIDVRTTAQHNNRLILHKEDPDDRQFWLVTGRYGDYNVRGWILGSEGKSQVYWIDPTGKNRPAFFIPQNALNGTD